MLPEPFSQQSQILGTEQLTADSFIESQSTSIECEALSEKFHLYPSLTRHFSQKAVGAETEKTQPLASPVPLLSVSSNSLINQESIIGQQRGVTGVCSKFDGVTNQNIESEQHKESPATCLVSTIVKSPIQQIKSSSTPIAKLGSSVDCLMLETPAQLTPRRSVPSENKLKTPTNQRLTSCEKPAKRALDFSDLEHNKSELDSIVNESGCKNAVHDDVLHSTEGIFKDRNVTGSLPLLQEVCCSPTLPATCLNQSYMWQFIHNSSIYHQ
jgi:chromatin licensing and DNA replication factor 1